MVRNLILATATSVLALSFGSVDMAQAQVPQGAGLGLPYDAQRGVFSFAGDLEASLPAVVRVTTLGQSRGPARENDPKPSQGGSGVIIDAQKGIIVTNYHVIENGQKFTVDLIDGRLFDAVLIGGDKASDLAVLKIEGSNLSQVEMVDSDTLRTGDLAFAVGYPMDLDQTLTMGVISGLNRSGMGDAIEDYIQTDAAVNQGNSGGPLMDSRGRLIGINTAILSGGFGGGNDGIAFAVPTRILEFVVGQLLEHGAVSRGHVGLALGSLTAERAADLELKMVRGAVVYDVMPGSSAEAAGLLTGDIITRIQDRPVSNAGSVQASIGIVSPGTSVSLTYLRNGRSHEAKMQVEVSEPGAVHLGRTSVMARGLTARNADSGGTLVSVVDGASAAGRAGLVAGDVITSVAGQRISDVASLGRILSARSGPLALVVQRDGERVELRLEP